MLLKTRHVKVGNMLKATPANVDESLFHISLYSFAAKLAAAAAPTHLLLHGVVECLSRLLYLFGQLLSSSSPSSSPLLEFRK